MSIIQRLTPQDAYKAMTATSDALLIDVRDPVEYVFVGHPIHSKNIPWAFAPDMRKNSSFVEQVQEIAPSLDTPLFLLCRSGQRSFSAAKALEDQGYRQIINVEEGFEGDRNEFKQRSTLNGWRFQGLPWEQG
ncbi:MAG: rhodanese-like domain-containing protein [Gammaproteobacteria bacterium]|nr:rhodanese-like domain-containing protein [Gammaproteobacteria bacterium]NBT43855.1 rhodanese-like domain-containing protein [Gammaproteobacteria bacterium]NBY22446.1 rhodanese-like domain-containing protein [Gammaproteobacteria bacterium]